MSSPDLDAWIAEEEPSPEQVRQVTKLLESGFSTTTKVLLALAEFYESIVDCGPEMQAENMTAANLLRRFAREFAAHEDKTL